MSCDSHFKTHKCKSVGTQQLNFQPLSNYQLKWGIFSFTVENAGLWHQRPALYVYYSSRYSKLAIA